MKIKVSYIGIGVILVSFPFLLSCLMNTSWFDWAPGDDGDWLSFWSGYIGAASSVIVAFAVAKYETKETKEEQKKVIENQKDITITLKSIINEQKLMYFSEGIRALELHTDDFNSFINVARSVANEAIKVNDRSIQGLPLQMLISKYEQESNFIERYKEVAPPSSLPLVQSFITELSSLGSSISKIRESHEAASYRGFQDEDKADINYYGEIMVSNQLNNITKSYFALVNYFEDEKETQNLNE